jgi:hypothetical protein
VDQVEVHVEQVGLALGAMDDVTLPYLLGQGAWLGAHGRMVAGWRGSVTRFFHDMDI